MKNMKNMKSWNLKHYEKYLFLCRFWWFGSLGVAASNSLENFNIISREDVDFGLRSGPGRPIFVFLSIFVTFENLYICKIYIYIYIYLYIYIYIYKINYKNSLYAYTNICMHTKIFCMHTKIFVCIHKIFVWPHLRKQNSNIGAYKRGAAAEGRRPLL